MSSMTDQHLAIFEDIGRHSNEGVLLYSYSTRSVLYYNSLASELMGSNGSVTRLEEIFEAVIPEDRPYVDRCISLVFDEFKSSELEFRISDKTQTDRKRYVCCNAIPLSSIEAVAFFLKDISRAKEHETYLSKYAAKKNTLLDTLTHQISSSLFLSKNLLDHQFTGKQTGDAMYQTKIELLKNNTAHCLELIENLINREFQESPEIFVRKARINILERIQFVVEELQRSFRNRRFVLNASKTEIAMNTDEVKLVQVINNLVSNAIKFSKEPEEIAIDIFEEHENVVLRVTDRGIGIPENLKQFIFDRKSSAGRIGLNGETSRGMGLYICAKLIALLNGSISFESKEGKGSIFYCIVPKD
jgi:two-component system, OmpR family, sensor histidine kinase VicK